MPSRLESCPAKETKAALAKHKEERVNKDKFKLYFEFSVPARMAKPHQLLALDRGERLKVLFKPLSGI